MSLVNRTLYHMCVGFCAMIMGACVIVVGAGLSLQQSTPQGELPSLTS